MPLKIKQPIAKQKDGVQAPCELISHAELDHRPLAIDCANYFIRRKRWLRTPPHTRAIFLQVQSFHSVYFTG